MKVSTMNMFLKAVVLSTVCVSGMTVAVVNDDVVVEVNKYQLGFEQQNILQNEYDKAEDEVVIIPTAGCPMRPCPGSWLEVN